VCWKKNIITTKTMSKLRKSKYQPTSNYVKAKRT